MTKGGMNEVNLWLYEKIFRIFRILHHLNRKVDKLMAVGQEVKAVLEQLNTATNDLAARIDALVAANQDDLSPDAQAEFKAISDRLNSLAKNPENPIP